MLPPAIAFSGLAISGQRATRGCGLPVRVDGLRRDPRDQNLHNREFYKSTFANRPSRIDLRKETTFRA